VVWGGGGVGWLGRCGDCSVLWGLDFFFFFVLCGCVGGSVGLFIQFAVF